MPIVLGNPAHNDLSLVQNPVARNYALNIKYVTLDHKTIIGVHFLKLRCTHLQAG